MVGGGQGGAKNMHQQQFEDSQRPPPTEDDPYKGGVATGRVCKQNNLTGCVATVASMRPFVRVARSQDSRETCIESFNRCSFHNSYLLKLCHCRVGF